MTIEHKLIVSLEARSADRRVYGLRPFSTARDDPLHGRDADRKIGGPRYLLKVKVHLAFVDLRIVSG
jgi:hypothetical protein